MRFSSAPIPRVLVITRDERPQHEIDKDAKINKVINATTHKTHAIAHIYQNAKSRIHIS